MKDLSKHTQIDWWSQLVKNTQLKEQKRLHSKHEVIIEEQLDDSNWASQNTSLKTIEQNSLVTSQEATDRVDSLAIALEEAGITDNVVANKLREIMDEAFTSTPDWQIIPDYKTMLDCIKVYLKMKSNKPDTQINIANIFWGKGWDL